MTSVARDLAKQIEYKYECNIEAFYDKNQDFVCKGAFTINVYDYGFHIAVSLGCNYAE